MPEYVDYCNIGKYVNKTMCPTQCTVEEYVNETERD
jgi:hypothetical protein